MRLLPVVDRAPPEGALSSTGVVPRQRVSPFRVGTQDQPATLLPAVRRAAVLILLLQLTGMLTLSTVEYYRVSLTKDFAMYSQAWWLIAHGHLNPHSTVLGMSFWRNDAEFVLWPLALLHFVDPQPVVLLWTQDVAVFATELVALRWVSRLVARSALRPRPAAVALGGAAIALAVNPWAWETIAFDFHPHTIAALFTVLVGYDLWAGRRRCWLWVPLALMCCAPASLYVAGVGVAGLLTATSRRQRLLSITVVASGLLWLASVSALGGAGLGGHGVALWYGYLVGAHSGHVGFLAVALGVLGHPGAVLAMLSHRWVIAFAFLAAVGVVGLLSPWGLCPALAVFVPAMLNADPAFVRYEEGFQIWPALPFVLVGTMAVITSWYRRGTTGRRFAVGVGAVWASLLAVLAGTVLPAIPASWIAVSQPAASLLRSVQQSTPPGAEIVADNGVAGGFGGRADVRVAGGTAFDLLSYAHGPVLIDRPAVVFVLAGGQGMGDPTLPEVMRSVRKLQSAGAVLTGQADGIEVLTWRPPARTSEVTVP